MNTIEHIVAQKVVDGEYSRAKNNRDTEITEYQQYLQLLDSERESKQYEWNSDVRIPEFVSHVLTQSAIDANQYFQSRDFVEVYLEDEGDEEKLNAEASKELINRTLNQKHLYHYQKYLRGKITSQLLGRTYAVCWWEQKSKSEVIGYETTYEETGVDIFGAPLINRSEQVPATRAVQTPIHKEVPIIDRFNYDIVTPENIFMDNKYVYSLQQKDWVIIRSEKNLETLKREAKDRGYFNLDDIERAMAPQETETSKDSYNNPVGGNVAETKPVSDITKDFDVLERFGSFWAIVEERDDKGYPTKIKPGYDEFGKIKDNAELLETIITFVVVGNTNVLIRFQPTPYVDWNGIPYKPIIRGLCYIHPAYDGGVGDGKYARELQLAIDDTINVSNDRVMLATLPTLKINRNELEDNPDVFIEPGHKIPLTNMDNLEELPISDNIQGALAQAGLFIDKMQQLDAIHPPAMGNTPNLASTTATAVAGAEHRTNIRTNYKSLTFENTFLTELYDMVVQMTWAFATPETGMKLMGKKVMNFDPAKDYFYRPVSQSIESEFSKSNKVKMWTQVLSYVAQIQHPDTVKLVNYVLNQIFLFMGDEFVNFGKQLLNQQTPIQAQGANPEGAPGVNASNQNGIPQGLTEQSVRNNNA